MNLSIRGLRVLPSYLGATPRAQESRNPSPGLGQWNRRSIHAPLFGAPKTRSLRANHAASAARRDGRPTPVVPR